uniref:SCAN box domain-containing protein n=1 Tax=Crocodylus porosus TaxID=8502 RepID=A0A7M4F0H6_CROPO
IVEEPRPQAALGLTGQGGACPPGAGSVGTQDRRGVAPLEPGEILRRLDIMPERQRQAFRAKKSVEVRTPRILWQALADLLSKWLRPENTSKEQIVDLVLMEQFINDLEEETQKWVRCHSRLAGAGSVGMQDRRGAAPPEPARKPGSESPRRDQRHAL